jgi:hypothetical protein
MLVEGKQSLIIITYLRKETADRVYPDITLGRFSGGV